MARLTVLCGTVGLAQRSGVDTPESKALRDESECHHHRSLTKHRSSSTHSRDLIPIDQRCALIHERALQHALLKPSTFLYKQKRGETEP